MMALSTWISKVVKEVARIIALALGLEGDFFDKPEMLGEPIAIVRLLHYEGKSKLPSTGYYSCISLTNHCYYSKPLCMITL